MTSSSLVQIGDLTPGMVIDYDGAGWLDVIDEVTEDQKLPGVKLIIAYRFNGELGGAQFRAQRIGYLISKMAPGLKLMGVFNG